MAADFALPHDFATDASAAVDTVLTQEAGRIGQDIHKATLHTSPWIDLIKQSTFPEGMGYQLSTLIYDRALPLSPINKDFTDSGISVGVDFSPIGSTHTAAANGMSANQQDQTLAMGTEKASVNTLDFTKVQKNYSLERAIVESPRINVEELRYTAHRTEQLRAIMDILKEATRNSWEERYRDEYSKLCDNVVECSATGTATNTDLEGTVITDINVDTGNNGCDIDANISNKILDDVYFKLVRAGAGANAYGRENGRPVFSVVLSSEASYQLMTEAGFRDDVRYNNARVSDLIAPLGVEKSFRGFYHLVDDLAPRFTFDASTDKLVRVDPYTVSATGGSATNKVIVNTNYETASFEAAYVLVDNVMESLIPAPITNANGLSFNPVNYKGEFKWTNIPDVSLNPDGTIGFFRGILASASKPIKTNFGYAILFKRDSSTPAA
tara:strand:+ start:824 stop:2143 length:1320 start_codon:yes stop_codon:yes gene_type:complete